MLSAGLLKKKLGDDETMFCHKCGTQIAEGAIFCHKCGAKVVHTDTESPEPEVSDANKPDSPAPATPPDRDILRCPNCHSSDLIPITETRTDVSGGGYGVGKGCCGWILLGPFGLLCGLCGTEVKSNTRTITSWVCKDCGNKFRNPMDARAEEKAEQMASCASLLSGAGILYVVGNLLSDYELEFLGIPNWVFIALGALGMILGAAGVLMSAFENLDNLDEAKRKKLIAAIFIFSVAAFVSGVIFVIADIRFFWVPAWIYILAGLPGTLSFLGKVLDKYEDKHGPLLKNIIEKIKRK